MAGLGNLLSSSSNVVLSGIRTWIGRTSHLDHWHLCYISRRSQGPSTSHHFTILTGMLCNSFRTSAERVEELKICRTAINGLRQIFMIPYTREDSVPNSAHFVWLILVSQAYINLLSKKRPETLPLFAHRCVLLKKTEPAGHIDARALQLITVVYESLDLDCRQCIKWLIKIAGFEEKPRWPLFGVCLRPSSLRFFPN